MNLADVGFIDQRPHLQFLQILGDQEQARGVCIRGHCLAQIDGAVNDDAFGRRADAGVAELDFSLLQSNLALD